MPQTLPYIYRLRNDMVVRTWTETVEALNNGTIPVDSVIYRYELDKRGVVNGPQPRANNIVWDDDSNTENA
jgi:hypothetical protein